MDPSERLPTEDEINIHGSLDEYSACERFLGKSRAEAERMFAGESGQELLFDLGHMGPVAFRYYFPAAVAMIRSDAAADRPDLVSGFMVVLQGLLYDEFLVSKHLASYCAEICDQMLDSWDRFGMNDVYESDLSEFVKLQRCFRRIAGQP
jgi:hypothetical protein